MQNPKESDNTHFLPQQEIPMKKSRSIAAFMATLAIAVPAMAQFKNAEEAIKYRKAAFTVMGQHFGQIGAMANGRVPFDAQKAKDDAALVRSLSQLPWAAFGPGTDMGETKAKPEIWKEQAKFKAAADTAMGELSKLDAAAKTGNLDQIKTAFGAAAQSCKACHDAYRAK
jgi:cytochrome c556